MVFASPEARKPLRDLANKFGVDFENANYELWDQEFP